MSTKRILVIASAAVIASLFATVTMAGAVYLGVRSTVTTAAAQVPVDGSAKTTGIAVQSAVAPLQESAAAASSTFVPGSPPTPQGAAGLGGDGVFVSGVAYTQTTDNTAQPDSALVKAAFTDAQRKAQVLASAAGVKLGTLLAMTEYNQVQPYFKPCVMPLPGIPPKGGSTGSGGTGSGGAGSGTATGAPAIAPAPVQSCTPNQYLVVWVTVRYQVGG